MAQSEKRHVSEQESMAVAEASRETQWLKPSFLKELFLGNFRLDLIHPFPLDERPEEWRPEFREFYDAMHHLLVHEVDSVEIDRTGIYPDHLLSRLRELGAFGMKIPAEYGGLGFSKVLALELLAAEQLERLRHADRLVGREQRADAAVDGGGPSSSSSTTRCAGC